MREITMDMRGRIAEVDIPEDMASELRIGDEFEVVVRVTVSGNGEKWLERKGITRQDIQVKPTSARLNGSDVATKASTPAPIDPPRKQAEPQTTDTGDAPTGTENYVPMVLDQDPDDFPGEGERRTVGQIPAPTDPVAARFAKADD